VLRQTAPPDATRTQEQAMAAFRKLMSDIADIRAAVNAAREYSVLASLPRDAAQRRDPLKAFLPN
jgi:hypothetical protein